jgi:hypothetical protein
MFPGMLYQTIIFQSRSDTVSGMCQCEYVPGSFSVTILWRRSMIPSESPGPVEYSDAMVEGRMRSICLCNVKIVTRAQTKSPCIDVCVRRGSEGACV